MASNVEIANRALQMLGAERITSLTEDSVNARAVNAAFEPVKLAELRKHTWSFAVTRAQLAASATAPLFTKTTSYPLPSDFIRLLAPDPEVKGKLIWERRYVAFVIAKDRDAVTIGLGAVDVLNEQINVFRRPFSSEHNTPANPVAGMMAGQQLREILWKPIEKHLQGIDTVIISPDTVLGTLPMAALPGRRPGSYLQAERCRAAGG